MPDFVKSLEIHRPRNTPQFSTVGSGPKLCITCEQLIKADLHISHLIENQIDALITIWFPQNTYIKN